jgi:hypothetical protein
MIGSTLSHFRITAKLGQGGMGEVYRATDTRLDREVAIKVMPLEFAASPERLSRFEREAKSVAALNHPNIVTLYSVEEEGDQPFLTMELVSGETLDRAIPQGGLPLDSFVRLALQLTDGVAAAHRAGIVHRDLKPGNVMVTTEGRLKILDFGLAKLKEPVETEAPGSELPTALLTEEGRVLGTPAYMAPEQAAGRAVDVRADVFALGAVLYEMLTGARPFSGASRAEVREAILATDPEPPRKRRREIPRALEAAVLRALEKRPEARYASAEELDAALRAATREIGAPEAGARSLVRNPVVLAGALVLLLAVAAAAWLFAREARATRARGETLPEIERLLEENRVVEAYFLARQTEKLLPEDPLLRELMGRASDRVQVSTDPPGAEVLYRDYRISEIPWQSLGRAPLLDAVVPAAVYLRWRVEQEGFVSLEAGGSPKELSLDFKLSSPDEAPPGMLYVPAGTPTFGGGEQMEVPAFWLDRLEVTNRQYQAFVDAGGYREREYWTQALEAEAPELSWEATIASFVDATGRPGPSTWTLGRYPEGMGDHPVGGVSWFEAAAYAAFAGKSLPTVYHWRQAAPWTPFGDMLALSNFASDGPVGVGSAGAVGRYGQHDMAGNVAEWCWNRAAEGRHLLGGAWDEPSYVFANNVAFSPFERGASMGFRCARFPTPLEPKLRAPVGADRYDFSDVEPVPDEVFAIYRSLFDYLPAPLGSRIEAVDDAGSYWRRETVSFTAAYGNERMIAHLFLPRDVAPPYQAVIYAASSAANQHSSVESLRSDPAFFIPRSGRALVWPATEGTLERGGGRGWPFVSSPRGQRDVMIHKVNDLQRTVDYLETREDIDRDHLGFFGLSAGSEYGPLYTAIEQRFRAVVFLAGGFDDFHMLREPGEINPWNYASRVRAPTLMINGRNDYGIPVATGQRPMFDLLGVDPTNKRHVVLDGGHFPHDLKAMMRETLDWYDRYLGPVRR